MTTRHIEMALAVVLFASVTAGNASAQTDFRAEAFAARKAGEWKKAAGLFRKLFEAGAADREILVEGASCLEKVGRYNDALDLLSRGKKKFPTDAVFRVGLARVFNLQAATLFATSGKLDSHVVFNFQDAIREGEDLLKTAPDNRDARLIVANSHYSLGDWDKTRPHAEELVKRFPDHPGGHIIMGDLAFEHYKLLRQRAGKPGGDTSNEAMQKIVGAREAARASFTKAIKLDPKRSVSHRKLGDVCAWNGEVARALTEYGNALLLRPRSPIPHGWISSNVTPKQRGKFYEDLGKRFLAGDHKDKSQGALFAWYCASAATATKEYAKSEALYEAAIQLDPKYRQGYYFAMYSAYFYRNNAQDALRFAVAYAKVAPVEFSDTVRAVPIAKREAISDLLKFLAKSAGDLKMIAASRDLNHVLAGVLDTADAWNNYAFMARESGKYDESESAYRHALEIQPTSGQLMNDLGVILQFHRTSPAAWSEARKLYLAALKAAERVLKDKKASAEDRKTAETTKRDATNNLRELAILVKKAKRDKKD